MHITLYHNALIPPSTYGGTERVLYWLGKALISLGHEVTLIAREGSQLPGGDTVPLSPTDRPNWHQFIPARTDIVHLQATPAMPLKRPFLVTIHGNGQPGEEFHPNTVFLSRRHAELHGSQHFVYNGIDPTEYRCNLEREEYLAFLAKASWKVKNLRGAIQVSRASGLPLEIMGSRHLPRNLQRARNLFSGLRGLRYHGMVGDEAKRRLLSKARGLVFPVRWNEPFGLAVTEALASGCPVFATPYGSLSELVTPDVGFLSANAGDLAHAIQHRKFSPEKCRERVLNGLTHMDMAKGYLHFYERVLSDGNLGPSPKVQESPKILLPWRS